MVVMPLILFRKEVVPASVGERNGCHNKLQRIQRRNHRNHLFAGS
jgi:hypothetical protein